MKRILEIIKVARPGFWPTHVWFYLLPLAGRNMFDSAAFWLGSIYVCFPLGLLLYGWNDLTDSETDQLNPRKDSWLFGARPDKRTRMALPFVIAAAQLPFLAAFVWVAGIRMAGWFALAVLANATYNSIGFKKLPVLDLLNQVGYILIFVLASWLCDVPQLNMPAMIFGGMFAMQSHLFGQLMDYDEDLAAGRRSTVVLIGILPGKMLLVSIMIVETVIAYHFFRGPQVAIFMGAGAMFFVADAAFGPRNYPVWFSKLFFIGWNVVVLTTMYFVWSYEIFLVK